MTKRSYSDEERANALAALAANGGSVPITAARLGIPARTLWNWATGIRHPEAAQMGMQKKSELAAALRGIAWLALDMLPAKLKKATAKDAATTIGIALDKALLLSGEPNAITRNDELTDDQRRARLAAYLERLRPDRNGDGAGHPNGDVAGPPPSEPAPNPG